MKRKNFSAFLAIKHIVRKIGAHNVLDFETQLLRTCCGQMFAKNQRPKGELPS